MPDSKANREQISRTPCCKRPLANADATPPFPFGNLRPQPRTAESDTISNRTAFANARTAAYRSTRRSTMAEITKRAQQALATKNAIFQCALELFAQRPYEQISVKDICEAAEVSVGAFYHHFKSKDNLLDEGYRLFDQQLEHVWNTRAAESPLDDVHLLVRHQLNSMERMGGFAAAQYFKNQLSVDRSHMLDPQRVLNIRLIESLRACVETGVLRGNPEQMAEEILCVTRGIIYDWVLHGNAYDLEARGRHIVDIVLEHYTA